MKQKVKKLGALLLCCTLLAGCGGGDNNNAGSSEASTSTAGSDQALGTGSSLFTGELERNVTIRVLENDTAIQRGYFADLIEAFNEKYKEYGIVAVDANMDQYLDLANDGPFGYGPDVLYHANDVLMKYVTGKHILPLPVEKLECYDKIPESAWSAYQAEIGGNVYTCGVPVNVQAGMLFYRKDLLPQDWENKWDQDKNGIPDMVETWNRMYAYSKELHQADPSKYGYMKSLFDAYFSTGFLFSYGGYLFGDNNTNPSEIGFSAGEAEKGAMIIKQLASVMNEECIDDTITRNADVKMAEGSYFATITTPDVYTSFLKELISSYEKQGLSNEEATAKAKENLVLTTLPKLPASGDLTEENPELTTHKTLGGINGYAVSAYTKSPNACLAFVDFATSYEQMISRNETLGIAPARSDAAEKAGGFSQLLYDELAKENIIIMPSIQELAQMWTPAHTFFTDLAKDAFRPEAEQKFKDFESAKAGLKTVDQQIYDAIFTLTSK